MANWKIERMHHTMISVTDLDRSLQFYKELGFEILSDRRDVDWPDFAADVYGLTSPKARAVLMNHPDDPDGPLLDIIQWLRPKLPAPVSGEVPPRVIAFRVKNIKECAVDLKRRNIPSFSFVEPPEAMGTLGVICARDPDGTLIEFIEIAPGLRVSSVREALLKD
jgi:catechol 2,3-dioxygenase-like lactoylglutathione lyase family enzyme